MTEMLERAYGEAERYSSRAEGALANVARGYLADSPGDEGPSESAVEMAKFLYWRQASAGDVLARQAELHSRQSELRDLVILAHLGDGGDTEIASQDSENQRPVVPAIHRILWFSLLFIGLIWGFVAGVSMTGPVWVEPASGIFGVFAVVVLGLTLNKMGQRRA